MNVKVATRKMRTQKGFTLLELLVVIAIVGILATLAVPRFQGQMDKARFAEVVSATAPFKSAVEVCVQRTGALATCTAGAAGTGIPAAVGAVAGTNIAGVAVAAGVITATGSGVVGGDTYILTPTLAGSAVTWATGGTCFTNARCD